MSASEGDGLMRPFSKKSGGARCVIDKNCVRTLVKNISVRLLPTADSGTLRPNLEDSLR